MKCHGLPPRATKTTRQYRHKSSFALCLRCGRTFRSSCTSVYTPSGRICRALAENKTSSCADTAGNAEGAAGHGAGRRFYLRSSTVRVHSRRQKLVFLVCRRTSRVLSMRWSHGLSFAQDDPAAPCRRTRSLLVPTLPYSFSVPAACAASSLFPRRCGAALFSYGAGCISFHNRVFSL